MEEGEFTRGVMPIGERRRGRSAYFGRCVAAAATLVSRRGISIA
jgi:hypothetical protein